MVGDRVSRGHGTGVSARPAPMEIVAHVGSTTEVLSVLIVVHQRDSEGLCRPLHEDTQRIRSTAHTATPHVLRSEQ